MVYYCKAIRLYNMEKLQFMRLWDVYSGLLTPTQQDITNLYFNLDLTLTEIAEQKGISRQAVSDCLNACRRQLEEYEERLKVVQNNIKADLQISFMLTDAARWAEKFKLAHPQYGQEMAELDAILHGDYSAEAEKIYNDPAATAAFKLAQSGSDGKK